MVSALLRFVLKGKSAEEIIALKTFVLFSILFLVTNKKNVLGIFCFAV